VTPSGDNGNEMSPTWLLDDETIEAIVAGDEVDARFDRIVAFARQVEAMGDRAAPAPTPVLRTVLAGSAAEAATLEVPAVDATLDAWSPADLEPGAPADPTVVDLAGRRRWRERPGGRTATAAKLAGLGVAAKVGLGTSMAFAGFVGAGAAGVLPAQATEHVRGAIEVVTPVDFGDDDPPDTITTGEDPAGSGDRVSGVPRESDGLPGAGGDVSGESPGPGRPPVLRGEGNDGQDRPRDTRPPSTAPGRHTPPAPPAPPHEGDRTPTTSRSGPADDQGDDGGEGDDDEEDDEDDDGEGGVSGSGNGTGNANAPGQRRTTTTTTSPPTTTTTTIPPPATGGG
jgi:hypothetical protein